MIEPVNIRNLNMPSSLFKGHEARWYLLGLVLLTVLVFFKTLSFEFVWDDHIFLVGQASYQSVTLKQLLLSPINGVEYLPLRDLTYIIDYQVWGWNPFGFHLTNLVLYCLNIWAVYRLTIALNSTLFPIESKRKNDGTVWTALVTAAFFAVLPLHSEAVSFIHGRNVLLSGLFFFLSCIYFLKFIEHKLWRHIVVSLVLFAFALFSKATVIVLPLILLIFLYFRPVQKRNYYAGMLPFVSLAIVFYFIFKFLATESQVINDELVLTMGRYDVASRVAVAVQIPYFYMTKLFVPVGLSTEYQIEFSRSVFSPVVILALLGLFLSLSLAYYFRRKFPQALFALLWFVTCLLPVLNFFLTNPVVADRYVYLSSYAYAYILATLFFEVGKRIDHPRLLMVLLPVLGVYAWMAFERNDVWRTHLSVMEDMTKPFSNQVKGFNALGQYYFNVGQFPKALTNFQKAKEISPAFSELEFHKAKLAFQQNRPLEALELLNAASRLNEKETHEAWSLRGQIHESQGDLIQAARRYRESVESVHFTKSTREQAVSRLQRVMTKLEPSLEATRKDILDHPGDLNLKANFAVMLQSVGLNKEALALYEELLRLGGPKWEVYANLGMLYKKEGQIEQSIHNYNMSLSLNNTSARIHDELGIVYFQAGKFEAALNHFQTGVELDPKSANALLNLARLHFQLGNDQLARQTFNRLLLEFPEYEALAREYLLKLSRS